MIMIDNVYDVVKEHEGEDFEQASFSENAAWQTANFLDATDADVEDMVNLPVYTLYSFAKYLGELHV